MTAYLLLRTTTKTLQDAIEQVKCLGKLPGSEKHLSRLRIDTCTDAFRFKMDKYNVLFVTFLQLFYQTTMIDGAIVISLKSVINTDH